MLAPGACRGECCDHRLWKYLGASPWGFLPPPPPVFSALQAGHGITWEGPLDLTGFFRRDRKTTSNELLQIFQ